MVAKTDPALLGAMLDHGLLASQLLRLALLLVDEQELPAIDGSAMSSAIALLNLETLSPPRVAPAKPRFDRGTKPSK